ncbi:transposase [Epilithonimonas xixisoli]|uniref:Uncharacterized protein n=1 Tax=Epilithonimonas xixisoli TaxID=1476462 RepID=A0A4R8I7K8_9FLAO|nr:transposase [Epilithonimonas xixisoli]TDX82562.1 hypothetical protein B0I22_2570 [Epilithonimonas xixisoli]
MSFKNIHIGKLLEKRVEECDIEIDRICNFLNCSEEEVQKMYECKSLDTELLLRWSKLLEYDFFRLYTQHLILFAPQSASQKIKNLEKSPLPQFRKNIYTKEVIDFILEEITTGNKTKLQIVEEYKIPKTTLYKWISKYKN